MINATEPTREDLAKLLSYVLFPKLTHTVRESSIALTSKSLKSHTKELVNRLKKKLPVELQDEFELKQNAACRYGSPLIGLTNELIDKRQGKALKSLSLFVNAEGFSLPLPIESKLNQHAYDELVFMFAHAHPNLRQQAPVLAHTLLFDQQIVKQSGHVLAGLHAALREIQPEDITYLCGLTLAPIYDTRKFARVLEYFAPKKPSANIYYLFTDLDKWAPHVEFLANSDIPLPKDFTELIISASNFPKVFAMFSRLFLAGKIPFTAQEIFDFMYAVPNFWIRQPNEHATPTLRNYSNMLGFLRKQGVDISPINPLLKSAAQTVLNVYTANRQGHHLRHPLLRLMQQLDHPKLIESKASSDGSTEAEKILIAYEQLIQLQAKA